MIDCKLLSWTFRVNFTWKLKSFKSRKLQTCSKTAYRRKRVIKQVFLGQSTKKMQVHLFYQLLVIGINPKYADLVTVEKDSISCRIQCCLHTGIALLHRKYSFKILSFHLLNSVFESHSLKKLQISPSLILHWVNTLWLGNLDC